MFFLPY